VCVCVGGGAVVGGKDDPEPLSVLGALNVVPS